MAEVVAGLLTSAVVEIAVNKLSSTIQEQANLALSFSDDLEEMKETMESIVVVFKDAEKQSVKNETVRLWLKRLKYAALDISDMIDDYQDDDSRSTAKMPGMLSCFTTARKKMVLANKMKNMRDHLRRINEQCQRFTFTTTITSNQDQQCYDVRETISAVNEAWIFGREAEKKEIADMLSATHKKDGTMVLPIYGLGGMGKSTLAQLVYNDTQLKQYDHRVWVYVSEVFDLKKVGRTIISQLSTDGGHQNVNTLELIQQHLNELLPGKKILIILDDIWQEDASELDKLKHMLHVDKKGSTVDVLVTTRSEYIAKEICTNEAYKLQPLTDNICWDIIKRYSGFEKKSNHEKLVEIGLEISQKCGGMPLAAQALGYLLKLKDLDGWIEIKNSDIWNESSESDGLQHRKVLPSLKLSYERMPPLLRLCFSYCAIFPKGHNIYEDDLVHQWLALDLIKKPLEGKEYINQLLGMSFFQHSKLPTISGNNVTRYTMHDLVHDLARSVVGDELIEIDAGGKVKKYEQKYCRYAFLTNYDGQAKLSDILPKKVRALHFACSSKLGPHDGLFSIVKRLRVLDFSECSGIFLPSTIDRLKELRCLISPNLQNESLPEGIVELPKLQYLNLRGSSLISVAIGNMANLKYLNVSRMNIISIDFIGTLTNLEHLVLSQCWKIKSLPDSIGNLKNLHTLDLSYCDFLQSLPESIGNLKKLHTVVLSYCSRLASVPDSIFIIPSLKQVSVGGCPDEVIELINSMLNFSLTLPLFAVRADLINACSNLPLLGGTNLVKLNIHFLENVFSVEEARKANLLDKDKLSELSLAWTSCCGYRFVDPEALLEQLVPPTGLKGLHLRNYVGESFPGWFKNISHHLPNLVSIELYNLWNCNNLPPLGQLQNLEKLELRYCNRVTKIGKDFCGGKGAFRRLLKLTLHDLKRLEEWSTTYSFEDGMEEFMFPVLDEVAIYDCPRLRLTPHPPVCRVFLVQRSDGVISSLEVLGNNNNGRLTCSTISTTSMQIHYSNCQSLNLFHHFTALKELELFNCSQLTSLPESMRHLKSLEWLTLHRCDSISALPEWLDDLSSLKSLTIIACEGIKD